MEVVLLAATVKVGVGGGSFIGIIVKYLDFHLVDGLVIDSQLGHFTLSTSFGTACTGLGFGFFYHVVDGFCGSVGGASDS